MARGQSVANIIRLPDDTRPLFLHHNGATVRRLEMFQTNNRLSFQLITNEISKTVLTSYHPTGLSHVRFTAITILFLVFHHQIVIGIFFNHIGTQCVGRKGAIGRYS